VVEGNINLHPYPAHTYVYRHRSDVNGVVHTH
jgi:ribulose-5-phosphate 4-epimerase/fuculose-1-phosphate aldolase